MHSKIDLIRFSVFSMNADRKVFVITRFGANVQGLIIRYDEVSKSDKVRCDSLLRQYNTGSA